MDLHTLHPKLEELFKSRRVRLAYLFGSQVSGRLHSESDVDVAVLFDASLSPDARFDERLVLIGELCRILGTDHVDLAVLNEAPPLLAFEVLRNGKLLYSASEDDRVEFQVRTVREYEDTEPLRKLLAEAMEERVKAGAFGKRVLSEKK
ncbi:MAG: nucleotidyltransferase domain-containing protein [Planctomycetes bacterium]|nr:nucleotidyltransferase domain-containing protein [Planctomycetota bacterium]